MTRKGVHRAPPRHPARQPHPPPSIVPAFARTALIAGGAFLGVVLLVIAAPGNPVDAAVAAWTTGGRSSWLLDLSAAIRFVASQAPFALAPALAVLLWWRRRREAAVLVAGVFAAGLVISVAIKLVVARDRPPAGIAGLPIQPDETSFPSTSVVLCVAFWGCAAALALLARRPWGRYLALIAGALMVLIGLSRLYVADHWLTDVVAGYLFGVAIVSVGLHMYLKPR